MAEEKDVAQVMSMIAKMREVSQEKGYAPAEVEKAAAKSAEWMLRYNITSADLDRHAKSSGRAVVKESYPVAMTWRENLLVVVADAHLCKTIKHTGGKRRRDGLGGHMSVVGHEHNLIVVRETWQWLVREGERLATEYHQHARLNSLDARALHQPTQWKTDFKAGFVTGIDKAYRQMRSEVQESVSASEWAIVPLMSQEVAQTFNQLFPVQRQGTGTKVRLTSAYGHGIKAGESTNLGRQVGGSGSATAGALGGGGRG